MPDFLGTVDLDFTPASSTALNFLGQYTFTATDNGRHTFLFSSVTQAGAGTLSVFAVGMPTATDPLTVVPAALNKFVFAAPATTPAGTPFSFTITAEDRFGNVETGYTGTVHFSALANDTQAVLPPDTTFTAADGGTHTFTATLTRTAGASSPFINARDLATGVNTFGTIFVTPLAPTSISISGASSTPVAIPTSVLVSALDQFGNVATSYTGTVHFASSDPQAGLPADYTFTAADGGILNFTVTLKTAGTQSVSAADTAHPSLTISTSISVVPGAVDHFAISGPTSVAKGVGFKITVTAEDAFGNIVTGYRGTVHLSSTDATGGTQNFTFSNNDNGVHIFSYTFNALGLQTITVADTTNSSIIGSIVEDVLAQSGGGGGGGGGAA